MAPTFDNYADQAKPKRQRSNSPVGHDESGHEIRQEFRNKRSKMENNYEVGSVGSVEKISVDAESTSDEARPILPEQTKSKRPRSPSFEMDREDVSPANTKKWKGGAAAEFDTFVPAVSYRSSVYHVATTLIPMAGRE